MPTQNPQPIETETQVPLETESGQELLTEGQVILMGQACM